MESVLRKWHHPPEDVRQQKSRFGSVPSRQCRLSTWCVTLCMYLLTCAVHRCVSEMPSSPSSPEWDTAFFTTRLWWDARATARKFACAAANLRYFQSICKLPRLEISVAFRIVIQVFAFHLTSCDKFVSWSFAVDTGTHFSHKNEFQVRCIWKRRSCLSYLNDNSGEIIVKLIQYKYVLSRLWSLEAWNIDRLAWGRCFWLFLQHTSCLYACAGIYGLSTALCLWNCETWEMHRLMWYSFQGD